MMCRSFVTLPPYMRTSTGPRSQRTRLANWTMTSTGRAGSVRAMEASEAGAEAGLENGVPASDAGDPWTSMSAAISINFIGDTMFVSTVHGVYSYDVSDPANPTLLGALPMYIWENEDVSVDPVRQLLYISRDPRGFTSPATGGDTFPYGAVHII